MPVFNAERFLREAIESILNQTYKDFEFIIINDGSTDNSKDIILSYNDKRIRYVENECNLKLIKTLNKGIDLAGGEYIARMDSDDISLPDRFERQIEVFKTHPDIDFINGRAYDMSEKGKILKEWDMPASSHTLRYINLFTTIICHPSVMIKSSVIKQFKYSDAPDVLHIEDYDLWARLFNSGYKCYSMDPPVLKYRIVGSGITRVHRGEMLEHVTVKVKEHFKELGFNISENAIRALYGHNNTFEGLKQLQECFASFNRFLSTNESKQVITQLKDWEKRRLLRIFKVLLREKKYVDTIKSFITVVLPELNAFLACLIKK